MVGPRICFWVSDSLVLYVLCVVVLDLLCCLKLFCLVDFAVGLVWLWWDVLVWVAGGYCGCFELVCC